MLCLISLCLLAQQSTTIPVAPATGAAPRARTQMPTLEGPLGNASLGAFDLSSGEFVPERLAAEWQRWSALTVVSLDFSGRSQATSGLASQPRRREDVGLGCRVELPGAGGTLFQLRGMEGGAPSFAIVHVDHTGQPRIVSQAPAIAGGGSPFLPKLGIGPRGAAVLIATRVEAGGDLFEANLGTGTLELRTTNVPPLDFGIDGVWLGSEWGFGVASSGPYRFLRRPLAQVEAVAVNGTSPATWRGDAAVSPSRRGAVAVAGSGPDLWLPYVFGPTGPARAATSTPSRLSPAGYAPESSFGPFLALCDDHVTAAWCVEEGASPNDFRDVYLGRPAPVPVVATASGDMQIIDTISEVGRILPSPAGGVIFAVGEPNDPTEGGLEGGEVLRATLGTGGSIALVNVSRTSTDLTLPLFNQGLLPTWTPAVFVLVAPTTALIHDDESKALFALNLVQNTRVQVLDAVREVYWIEAAGATGAPGSWVAAIERDDSQRRQQLVGASSAMGSALILDAGTPTAEFRGPAAWRLGAGAVGYIRRDMGMEWVVALHRDTLARVRWSSSSSVFTLPLVFTSPSSLAFTRQVSPAGVEQRVWTFNGPGLDTVFRATVRPAVLMR